MADRYDWPWWMKLANTKLKDGKVQLGALTGGKMDDITVLVAMVEETEVSVVDAEATALAAAAAAEATPAAAAAEDPVAAAGSSGSTTSILGKAPKVSSSSGSTYSLMEGSSSNGTKS